MKFSCLFSWSVGISLESWHIEQGINSDGAFRIFSHANRFKKIVATLASQVHCVTNVVQHARKIHMPCVCFCAGTRGREGTEGELGTICRGLEKIAWRACDSLFTCRAWKLGISCPACDSPLTCPACDYQFTCPACDSQFTCPACDSQVTCPACDSQFACPACEFLLLGHVNWQTHAGHVIWESHTGQMYDMKWNILMSDRHTTHLNSVNTDLKFYFFTLWIHVRHMLLHVHKRVSITHNIQLYDKIIIFTLCKFLYWHFKIHHLTRNVVIFWKSYHWNEVTNHSSLFAVFSRCEFFSSSENVWLATLVCHRALKHGLWIHSDKLDAREPVILQFNCEQKIFCSCVILLHTRHSSAQIVEMYCNSIYTSKPFHKALLIWFSFCFFPNFQTFAC